MKRTILWAVLFLFICQVGFAVFYKVDGVVSFHPDAVVLNTSDGRLFKLAMKADAAKKYDGKHVSVEGIIAQADELENLKVSKIMETPMKTDQIVPPPQYHIRQKAPRLIGKQADRINVENVRCGFSVDKNQVITQYNWRTMTVVPELVSTTYFIKKPFAPEWLAAHSCLLFTFKPGGLTDDQGKSYKGLLLSVEAHLTKEQNYSLIDGLKRKFGMIWLLIAWEDYSAEACDMVTRGAGKMILYPARFTHAQNVELVKETIKQACVNRDGEFYHTVMNNCTNTLVLLFNHVLAKPVKMWSIPGLIYNLKATMLTWVPDYLQKKGILEAPLPEINKTNYFADLEKLSPPRGK